MLIGAEQKERYEKTFFPIKNLCVFNKKKKKKKKKTSVWRERRRLRFIFRLENFSMSKFQFKASSSGYGKSIVVGKSGRKSHC